MGVQLQAVLITRGKHLFASDLAAGTYPEWTVSDTSGHAHYSLENNCCFQFGSAIAPFLHLSLCKTSSRALEEDQ